MSKINNTTAYPNTTPSLSDHVIGTDVSNTGNNPSGETVTFTLQAIMDVFEANFAAPASAITSGTFANARISQGSVTQHQGALSIGASQLTGTLANARVAEGNVTQHQAALSITESQISDFGTYETADADILKADTADELTAGFSHAPYSAGTKSSGTFTPDEANGNMQTATNGGAHTLAAPSEDCCIIIHYTNNGSAGTITLSGFDANSPRGDDFTTTNGHKFIVTIIKINGDATLTVQALQ